MTRPVWMFPPRAVAPDYEVSVHGHGSAHGVGSPNRAVHGPEVCEPLRTINVIDVPWISPEKCAAGGGPGIGGPIEMLNAPSASKCPSGATVGVGNDPPPQPTPTLTCVLVTVTHAPPPHRPSASVAGGATAFCGDVGVIVVTCCVALFVTA